MDTDERSLKKRREKEGKDRKEEVMKRQD